MLDFFVKTRSKKTDLTNSLQGLVAVMEHISLVQVLKKIKGARHGLEVNLQNLEVDVSEYILP